MKNDDDNILINSGIDNDITFDLKFREMLDTRRHERVVLAEADSKFIAVKFLFGLLMILAGLYFFIDMAL